MEQNVIDERAVEVAIVDTRTAVPTRSIENIVGYLWAAEEADFSAQPRADHVYRALCLVREWLGHLPEEAGQVGRKPDGTPVAEVSIDSAHWGLCPECGCNDGYLSLGAEHWMVCHAHRNRWCAGVNLFTSWREQSEEEFKENAGRLDGYRVVVPLHPALGPYGTGSQGVQLLVRHDEDEEIPLPWGPTYIPTYTREQVYEQYLANCKAANWPPVVPDVCCHCGFEILMPHAKGIMERGAYGCTGCRGCGRTYCD